MSCAKPEPTRAALSPKNLPSCRFSGPRVSGSRRYVPPFGATGGNDDGNDDNLPSNPRHASSPYASLHVQRCVWPDDPNDNRERDVSTRKLLVAGPLRCPLTVRPRLRKPAGAGLGRRWDREARGTSEATRKKVTAEQTRRQTATPSTALQRSPRALQAHYLPRSRCGWGACLLERLRGWSRAPRNNSTRIGVGVRKVQ